MVLKNCGDFVYVTSRSKCKFLLRLVLENTGWGCKAGHFPSFLPRKETCVYFWTQGIQRARVHGAEGGSRLGHVKSDAMRGLHYAAHRPVVTLPKRRKPEGRSRSGDRGELPHAATKGFARSYRINLRLVSELAFSSGHDEIFMHALCGSCAGCV